MQYNHRTLLRRIYSSQVILVAIRPFDLQFLELLIFFYAIAIAIVLNAIHRACIDGDYPQSTMMPQLLVYAFLLPRIQRGDKPTMTSAHRKNFNRRYLHDKSILEGETTCCNNLHVLQISMVYCFNSHNDSSYRYAAAMLYTDGSQVPSPRNLGTQEQKPRNLGTHR